MKDETSPTAQHDAALMVATAAVTIAVGVTLASVFGWVRPAGAGEGQAELASPSARVVLVPVELDPRGSAATPGSSGGLSETPSQFTGQPGVEEELDDEPDERGGDAWSAWREHERGEQRRGERERERFDD